MSTLTSTQRNTIKNSPKTARVLSEKYGVSTATIYKLKNSSESTGTKKVAKSLAKSNAKTTSTTTARKKSTVVSA